DDTNQLPYTTRWAPVVSSHNVCNEIRLTMKYYITLILCALLLDAQFCSCAKVSAKHALCKQACLKNFKTCCLRKCFRDFSGFKREECKRKLNK
ncbi:hypothetical protein LSAT2_027794, partial [Lamellibrachia satsuma]